MTKELYEGECKRIERIAKIHMPKCFELYDELEQKVVRKEMAVGGECCPRGFYCPSPTLDIRVGGIKRGSLRKNIPFGWDPSYIYGFDKDDNLLIVDVKHLSEKEYIIREGQYELGIRFREFDGRAEIVMLCECLYDAGRIKECGFYEYNSFENKITEISKETYEYSENKLEMTNEIFSPGTSISDDFKEILEINSDADNMDVFLKSTFEKNKYIFDVEDGFLKSYVVEHYYDNGKRKASVWDGHQFKVYQKRRANG